jgi:transposase InsO family protein
MHRKYVTHLLSAGVNLTAKKTRPRKPRSVTYGNRETYYLKKIWEVLDYPCGQRLAPMIPEMVRVLDKWNELKVPDKIARKLAHIVPSTIDAKLDRVKTELRRKVLGTTKPGSLLKNQIPIRTSSWDEQRPGYCELDTVAHCGGSAEGEFAYTLTTTDLLTGWTELEAILGKAQQRVKSALDKASKRLPFPLLGIDPDNGGEFINWGLLRWCAERKIDFTRGRPYQKNDNAHVEQKNWTHVRKVMGYDQIEEDRLVNLMNDLYRQELRLYMNFFRPTMKLVDKKRVGRHGEKIKRVYDTPKTPYQRTLDCPEVDEKVKEKLRQQYEQLNPAYLRRTIISKVKYLRNEILYVNRARKQKSKGR